MVKLGIVGAGHLGKIHIKLALQIPDIQLIGFYDSNPEQAKAVAAEFDVKAFSSYQDLLKEVDAVDIVTTTISHFDVAAEAIRNGKNVFIEKPLTSTVDQAATLVKLAKEADILAQVGYVERFNPAFLALQSANIGLDPMFIEAHRLAPWHTRGTDVSVVLDVMIHDIDIILHIIKSPVKRILASGVAVVSDNADIANVRIEFGNGATANLTASRISMKTMRKMRIFQKSKYIAIDFYEKKTELFEIQEDEPKDTGYATLELGERKKYLVGQLPEIHPVNSIQMELEAFAKAILSKTPPPVTIEEALYTQRIAQQIADKINAVPGTEN